MIEITSERGIRTTPLPPFRPICWIKTLIRSFPWFREWVSGHDYAIEIPFHLAEVECLRCEDCGHRSIGFYDVTDKEVLELFESKQKKV